MRISKTKTIPIAALFFSLLSAGINAQQVYPVTVKEAVDIAFKNVNDLKNARLDYKIAEARNQEITGLALPQINGGLQGNYNLSLPQIQFPDGTEKSIYDVLRKEGVPDASGNPITKEGEFTYRNFSFTTPWNFNGGISVNQLLFEPQVFVGLQARKTLLESSAWQLKLSEDEVKEAVYKNYYAVLIAEKSLVFVQESAKRLEKLAKDMTEMYKNGFAEKLDIDKATVSLNNTRSMETVLKNTIFNGYAVLKMNMGLKQADSLVLKDVLTTERVKEGILDDTFKYEDRSEVQLVNTAIKLQEYDVKRHKLSYFPTLAAHYNFHRNGQRNAQGNDNSAWFWYNSSAVGVSLNLPIFDGFQKKNKIKQSEFSLEKATNTLDQVKKGIDLEQAATKTTLVNAILTMDIQEKNMKLAESVFNTVKKKYEEGVGSSFETIQADTDLQQAQSNYFRALFEAVVAKISYIRSLGKL